MKANMADEVKLEVRRLCFAIMEIGFQRQFGDNLEAELLTHGMIDEMEPLLTSSYARIKVEDLRIACDAAFRPEQNRRPGETGDYTPSQLEAKIYLAASGVTMACDSSR